MVFADILVTMTSALDCDVLVAGGGPARARRCNSSANERSECDRNRAPALSGLTVDECFAGLTLRMQRIEVLVQALLEDLRV